MNQHEMRVFEFKKGAKLVQRIECDWVEARRSGNEMADDIGDIQLHVFNAPMKRWELMGTFHGNMRYTNAWGEKCIIRADFSGMDFENKEKTSKK